MADRYWIEGTSGNWNDTANWSTSSGGSGGASVPGVSDNAIFDGNGAGDCTFDVNVSVIDLITGDTAGGDYVGNLDMATYNLTCSGNFGGRMNCGIDFGSGSHSIAGDFNVRNASVTGGTATITLTGTGKTFTASNTRVDNGFYDVVFDGTYTISSISTYFENSLTINNDTTASAVIRLNAGCDFTFAANKTFTINSQCIATNTTGTYTIGTGTTMTGSGFFQYYRMQTGTYLPPAYTIECGYHCIAGSSPQTPTFQFRSGTTTLGDFTIDSQNSTSSQTYDLATNNASLDITGDVIWSATNTVTWSAGTGTITFNGAIDQTIDFSGESVEDFDIDKAAGDITFSDSVNPQSFTITSANNIILASAITITVDGNLTVSSVGFAMSGTTGAGFTVGGNVTLTGAAAQYIFIDDVDFNITGTATASYVVVRNSDASAGTTFSVTGGESYSVSGNTGWTITTPQHPLLTAVETNGTTTNSTTLAFSPPYGFGGHYLFNFSARAGTPGTVTVPPEWTEIDAQDQSFQTGQAERGIYYIADSGNPPASWTLTCDTSSRWAGGIARIINAHADFLDVSYVSASGLYGTDAVDDPARSPGIPLVTANTLLVPMVMIDQAAADPGLTAPSGYTLAYKEAPANSFAPLTAMAFKEQDAIETTANINWTNPADNREWIGDQIAIKTAYVAAAVKAAYNKQTISPLKGSIIRGL